MSARARKGIATLAAVAAASVFVAGTPASAQPGIASAGTGVDMDIGVLAKAPLGAWSDYAMSAKGSDKGVTVRYALVEKTATKLGLEIDTPTPKGEVLVRFDFGPHGPDAWKVVGGKMKMGEQSMDIPAQQLAAAPPMKKGEPPGDLVGNESVTTPAGTFACKHYKKAMQPDPKGPPMTIEMWMSDKAAPTGLVKSSIAAYGIEMTLAKTGSGAQAKLK